MLFLPVNFNSDAPPWDIDLGSWFFFFHNFFFMCPHICYEWILIEFRYKVIFGRHNEKIPSWIINWRKSPTDSKLNWIIRIRNCWKFEGELIMELIIPNGIPFGSKSKGKLSPRSYPIQCKKKWKFSFLSVGVNNQPS